jgi:hypothetical protein
MQFTNKLNLPQPIVDAVTKDTYSKGKADISVTELMDPPQMRALKVKYEDDLQEDVSDRLWALYGQIVHGIFERAEKTAIAERRLYINVEGWKIGGGMDRYTVQSGLLQDYKFTTVHKVTRKEPSEEWVVQLNVYAEILRQNEQEVKNLQIVALLRDWSKLAYDRELKKCEEKGYSCNYPSTQVKIIDLPLIPQKEVLTYIKDRVKLHKKALKGKYPQCSPEERWGGVRCKHYCSVSSVCKQFNKGEK